jgi:hypothetical protein
MAESFLTQQFTSPLTAGKGSSAPVPQRFGPDDVGTMESILSEGKSRLTNLQTQETGLAVEKANLTTRIANLTSEKLDYERKKEEFGAKQRQDEAKLNYDNIKRMFDDEINSPQYEEKKRLSKQIAEYSVFEPTQVTAPMLGVLFSAIGATGMLLGGNSKNHAKAALSAMNGMTEGFAKGREQYDKERKSAFDTNVKLLQTKLTAIKDGLEDARREAVLNKQAADQKVRETLAANEAQFLQQNTDRRGLESTIALVNGQLTNVTQALTLLGTKTNQLANQIFSKEVTIAAAKLTAKSRETAAEIAAGQKGLQIVIGPDGKPYQVRASDLPQLPSGQTGVTRIPSPQQPEKPTIVMTEGGAKGVYPSQLPVATGQEVRGGLGAKIDTGEKAPANVEKDIKQNALIASNMDATIDSAEKLFKDGKLTSIGFIKGMVDPSIAQLYTSPEEKRFIAKMGALVNQQLKLQSGATVTAAEFARQKGVLPLRTDTPETIIVKLQQWKELIEQETQVLGNAYPATVSKYFKPSLSQKMDERGAAAGQSSADERSQAQAAILKAQNNKDLTPDQKQKMIDQVKVVYKRETGLDL